MRHRSALGGGFWSLSTLVSMYVLYVTLHCGTHLIEWRSDGSGRLFGSALVPVYVGRIHVQTTDELPRRLLIDTLQNGLLRPSQNIRSTGATLVVAAMLYQRKS